MSIEQSNQLILLILNSVLMTLLSAALLGGAWLRQHALSQELQHIRAEYRQITSPLEGNSDTARKRASKQQLQATLKRLRGDRHRLSRQYTWSRLGMVTLHAVLLTFGISLFALALRSLISLDSLISISLVLFTIGSGGLLAGTGCILIDIAQGDRHTASISQGLGRMLAKMAQGWQRNKITPANLQAPNQSTLSAQPSLISKP